jgi:signal transduction histidine kinase
MDRGRRSLRSRARALPPERVDALLGLALLVDGLIEIALLTDLGGAALAESVAVVATMAGALSQRRRRPVLAMIVMLGCSTLGQRIVGRDLVDNVAGPYFATLLVTYSAGYELEGRRLWWSVAAGSALVLLNVSTDGYADTVGKVLFSLVLTIAGPVTFGQVLRNRARLNRALREKAQQLASEAEAAAGSAALDERTRIAAELHDVVAHALSAMTVQAAAARRQAERDPDVARAAFASAEATGREALTELRRLLGVLRKDDEELAFSPQPSLAHVGALVRRTEAAGLPVRLTVSGRPRALPAGVDLTAYRVVQEALRRAYDSGAAGRADVAIDYGPEHVAVDVVDDGPPDGRRLMGMRERVLVYGGELTAAAATAGGWRVSARLPTAEPTP